MAKLAIAHGNHLIELVDDRASIDELVDQAKELWEHTNEPGSANMGLGALKLGDAGQTSGGYA